MISSGAWRQQNRKPCCVSASLPFDWVFSHNILKPVSCFMTPLHFLEPLYCLCLENVSTLLFHKLFFFFQFVNFLGSRAYISIMGCSQLLIVMFCFPGYSELEKITLECIDSQGSDGWLSRDEMRSQRSRLSGFYTPTNKRREEASLPCIPSHLLNSWSFISGIPVVWFHFID